MGTFSENLRQILDVQGRTQAALARHLGVDAHRVTDWCRDKGKGPTPAQLVEISRFLNVDADALLPGPPGKVPILTRATAGQLAEDRPARGEPDHVARFQSGPFLVEPRAWRVNKDPFEEEGET